MIPDPQDLSPLHVMVETNDSPATAALERLTLVPNREQGRKLLSSSNTDDNKTQSASNAFDMSDLLDVTLSGESAQPFPMISWCLDGSDDSAHRSSTSSNTEKDQDPTLMRTEYLRRCSCPSSATTFSLGQRRRHSASPTMTMPSSHRFMVRSIALNSNLSQLETSSVTPLRSSEGSSSISDPLNDVDTTFAFDTNSWDR